MERLKEWLKLLIAEMQKCMNYSMERLKEWLKR